MRTPSVFVSSTCYDLKQVRADMKQFLESLGHEAVLSEYGSFPINPDAGTLDNCLKAVEDKADILILIVGTRYGSTTDHGKSITNLEFLTAKAKGIPLYIFVMRSLLDVLPVWKPNPSADFSYVVDSPKLFEFVATLKTTGEYWVSPFDTAEDIFGVLRTQLAYLFRDALQLRLRASSSGGLSARFRDLHGPALRLVIERPPGWEYLLFSQALEDELKGLSDLRRDWQYRIAIGAGARLSPKQLFLCIPEKFSEVRRIASNMATIVNEALQAAFGLPGQSGDPEAILYASHRLAGTYRTALEWKLEFERLDVPEEMETLRLLTGTSRRSNSNFHSS